MEIIYGENGGVSVLSQGRKIIESHKGRIVLADGYYFAAFDELLHRVTDTSPVGKTYVQIRCQGLEQSNLCGTWTPARFVERIVRAGHLWGNMTYVLAKNADEPQDNILNQLLK